MRLAHPLHHRSVRVLQVVAVLLVLAGSGAAAATRSGPAGSPTTTSSPPTSTSTSTGPTTSTTSTTSTTATTVPARSAAGKQVQTSVRFFQPYHDDRLRPGVRITGTRSGYCFTGSLPVDDPHAWRCIAGQAILDPCFAPPGMRSPRQLACGSPWTGVTLLDLVKPLPLADANRALAPTAGWLLQLGGGVRCQLAQGATAPVDGMRVAYVCARGAVAGPLRWAQQPWTVQLVRDHSAHPVLAVVRTVWGG